MTLALLPDRPQIARVRVGTARRDRLQVSQRAAALLARLDLRPPGLAPSAVLLVRALRDPLPGCISLEQAGGGAPARWQRAISESLARITQEAARPARGPVAAGAAAVLFADDAELVACLVLDWLGGRVAEHWWWRSVLGELSAREWLRKHVLARGELMVPAVAILAERREVTAWFARLDDTEATEAIAAVGRSHSVRLHALEAGSMTQPRAARNQGRRVMDVKVVERAPPRTAALERLLAIVPEVRAPALRQTQRQLAALVLSLARSPSWARAPQFALALRELENDIPPADAPARAVVELWRTEVAEPLEPRMEAGVEASARHDVLATESVPALQRLKFEERAAAVPATNASAQQAGLVEPAAAPAEAPPRTSGERGEPVEMRADEPDARVRTGFGGIFYLLNAALALKLYADFTSPRGSNLRVSPWDWLALIGRAWFGREFVRDPVWKLLAGLARREGRRLRRPRWLTAQIERLLARLAMALGEEHSSDIPAFVCRHAAEVVVTASAVHVHLSLASLPLALRVAGLDRDPGWIPAAGRSVAFHFE